MSCLLQEVFYLVIVLRFVSINKRPLWYIESVMLQRVDITKAAMGQKKLHWLTIFGDHQMDLESIAISFLAGSIAAKSLLGVELGVFDTDIVTHDNRQTINHIDVIIIQSFPYVS